MKTTLSFAGYFKSMFNMESYEIDFDKDMTIGDALDLFLERHPQFQEILDQRRAMILGRIKGMFTVDGVAATYDTILTDGSSVYVMQASIGG